MAHVFRECVDFPGVYVHDEDEINGERVAVKDSALYVKRHGRFVPMRQASKVWTLTSPQVKWLITRAQTAGVPPPPETTALVVERQKALGLR